MKRSWIVALLLLSLAGTGPGASAQSHPSSAPPGLKMEAAAAFDGYFKYGEWLPIRVQLENSGPDLGAEVRVRVTGSLGAITYAAPAPLPSGSRKQISVYVLPNNFSHVLKVDLVTGNKTVLSQEVLVNAQANVNYLVGLVAPERGALSFITGVSLPGQARPKVLIDLAPADLPERPEGLRSFDCLILNNSDTSSLTPRQKEALESWVRQGGRLVIGGGPGARRTIAGLPPSILPILPGRETELERLPALADFAGGAAIRVPGPFVAASGEEGNGRTLIAQDGLPLLREWAVGSGVVDFVALDLAVSPFDAWAGTTTFWEKLLSPGAAYPDWLPADMSARQMRSSQMIYALSQLPALDLPSIRGLGLLLILYVVLVGPINYLVLRRLRRLPWAWISIPGLTLAFSGAAFGLGYTMRGSDLILNKIAIIELYPEGRANVSSYLGLFSPARRSYEIEVRDSSLLSPLNPGYDPWGTGAISPGGEMVFVQGETSQVRSLGVNQWSMQTFVTEGTWANWGRIQGDLFLEEEALVGTLRNETPLILRDTYLMLGNQFVRLGDLGPGQEESVRMELPGNLDLGQPSSYLLIEEQLAQANSGPAQRKAELKRVLLSSVLEPSGGFGPVFSEFVSGVGGSPAQGLILIGWLDEAPPEVRVAGRAPNQQTTALFYASIAYHLPESDSFTLRPGFLPGRLVLSKGGGPCGPPGTSSVWVDRGEALFEFRAFEPATDIQVNKLTLRVDADYGTWGQPPEIAIYAWDSQTWAALKEPVIGVNVIPNAAGLVSADGLVQIRLSANTSGGGCLTLSLGLEGTR